MNHMVGFRLFSFKGKRSGLLVFIAALYLSLSSVYGSASTEPHRGGSLSVGLEADFNSLDPLDMGALVERMVSTSIYETLMDINEEGELEPMLAESLEPSEEGEVYRATLKEGITFHDGTPFNADAVVRNFKRLMDPNNSCRCAAEIAAVKDVLAVGPYEVEFQLHHPNASFPAVLADVAGMQPSPTAVEEKGDGYATNPVGTGPFRFVSWNRGGSFRVERNPDYWQDDLPYLDAVTYRPIPDQQTRMSSVLAGDIDLAAVPAPQDVARVQAGEDSDEVKLIEAPGLGTIFTMLNPNRPPLDDVRVRQALFHATDREAINTALNKSIFPLASSPFGPGMLGGELKADFPDYDLDKARSLLEDYGRPVKFTLSVSATPVSAQTAQVLQQLWRRVGIEVSIDQQEQRTLIGNAINNNFDAMYFRWPGRADPDLNSYQFFHSESPRNYTRYKNPKLDELLEKGRQELDMDRRIAIYREVAQILADEGPYLFMWATSQFFLVRNEVHGLPASPDGLPRVREVWLEEE